MKILIVEDNKELSGTMYQYLVKEGYRCEVSPSYHHAEDKLVSFSYDTIILDIALPDGSGMDLLQLLKSAQMNGNVLIVSAKNSLSDKLKGLDLGADDYITKPFHLPELHARIKAVYRSNHLDADNTVKFREIFLNTHRKEVRVNQTIIDLTSKEYDLLLYFMTNKNRVITKQSIAEHLWGDYTDNLDNFDFVYQHVKNLRKKISRAKGRDYIETVYGLGYKFNASLP